ncbi:MAG: hypothetical protein LBU47_01800 [Christensenellaceae bacterium]|nr:hypothetical protein [Christensenellaceae bacterium]
MGLPLLLTLALLMGCEKGSSLGKNQPGLDIEVGIVKALAGGVEYIPLQNWIYSYNAATGVAADGFRLQPAEIPDDLPSLQLTEDFKIIVEGNGASDELRYSLYDEDFQRVYFQAEEFTMPTKPGEYILSMETAWGNESGYEGYQYLFKLKADGKPTPEELGFDAQIVRTNGYSEGSEYPIVTVVTSKAALRHYFEENKICYDFAPREAVYADATIGFADAIQRYNNAFFEKKRLVVVVLEEGSGSIRHLVKKVGGNGEITIERLLPEPSTDDMAQWHILIELDQALEPKGFRVVLEDAKAS